MTAEFAFWLGGVLLVLGCFFLACARQRDDWGTIRCDLKNNADIVLENSLLKCRWGDTTFSDGAKNHVILELQDKRNRVDHGGEQLDGVWMGYGKGRGALTKAVVTVHGKKRKTVHLEWGQGQVIQDVSIFPNSPVLKIDYLAYGVNVVDIGRPGGKDKGSYVFYGDREWRQARRTITDTAFRKHPNEHHRLTDDLFPTYPHPIFLREWGGEPLDYHGWFICGVCDSSTGAGFGRVMPFAHIDIIKLLWQRGFEMFPHFGRAHQPYSGYLFMVTGGKEEILRIGKKIADGIQF